VSANETPTEAARAAEVVPPAGAPGWLAGALLVLAALSLTALGLAWATWQRQAEVQAELAKRVQQSAEQAAEARVLARQGESAGRDAAARVALLEARLAEVSLQRSQLEDLIQALSRSRDENLLADLDAALRVALQQVAITGTNEPLLAALKQADERLARFSQPRLDRVRRAVLADIERVKSAGTADLPNLSIRIDELVRQVDDLPLLASAAARRRALGVPPTAPARHRRWRRPHPPRQLPRRVGFPVGSMSVAGRCGAKAWKSCARSCA
jgi:uroporphyrin-III C-methyltransferase